MEAIVGGLPPVDGLAELTPTFSVVVLYTHPKTDPAAAFRSLVSFLQTKLEDRARARSVRCLGEEVLTTSDQIPGVGSLLELGFDELFVSVRERRTTPSWAGAETGTEDVANQLTLVLRRGPLVLVHTPVSDEALRKWLRTFKQLYQYLPPRVLGGTFSGDGKLVWLHGIHRRRSTKADSKTLVGIKVQDTLDDDEDASYTLSAATVDYIPDDESAVVRGRLTVSPNKSRIYWKFKVDLFTFLAAAAETCDTLDKALAGMPPADLFVQLAIPETDLANVFGAYDISVGDLDEMFIEPEADQEELAERVALLRDCFLEVRGRQDSAAFTVIVGFEGAEVGELSIRPEPRSDGFDLAVGYATTPSFDEKARAIRNAIGDGELLAVYYESAHTFRDGAINLERRVAPPFVRLRFEDFGTHVVTKEKPPFHGGQKLHDAIGRDGDVSLFAWVVDRYRSGWLVCDDGSGEVADFIHLTNDGALTAIHVKGANSAAEYRHVAVAPFQEVVGQAVKNLRQLDSGLLADRFSYNRGLRRAAWLDGERTTDLTGFVEQLRVRTASDKTFVTIVQPHLLKSVHDAARAAAEAGTPTRDSHSLVLLDGLLRSARKSVIARYDDLTVIGSV